MIYSVYDVLSIFADYLSIPATLAAGFILFKLRTIGAGILFSAFFLHFLAMDVSGWVEPRFSSAILAEEFYHSESTSLSRFLGDLVHVSFLALLLAPLVLAFEVWSGKVKKS